MKFIALVAGTRARYYLWAVALVSVCFTFFVAVNYNDSLLITLAVLGSGAFISILVINARVTRIKGKKEVFSEVTSNEGESASSERSKQMTFVNIVTSVYYSAILALITTGMALLIALTSSSLLLLIWAILASCVAISEYIVDATIDKALRRQRSLSRILSNQAKSVDNTDRSSAEVNKQKTFIELLASINETYFFGFLALFYGTITIFAASMSTNLVVITIMILVVCYSIAACVASATVDEAQRRIRPQ
ncbi:hypothetical protein CWE09_05190 [Aliidiomarina minuta]|uniref:Uncharacterized protein n=1 Tax=Aliidiomarina minuta TaxID=880057 RepID=A0A432W7U9_9GAMM|nr:hypothetical protein [Aliidiomarina minuta]RUO26122.1 hypothetical protein CWE09_05190 [Aliidiomarina minuta]